MAVSGFMMKYPIRIKTILQISLINSIAGMTDGFLYAYLPVIGPDLGFNAFMIGLLLSMNRFVRLIFNRFVAHLANKIGIKPLLIAGIVLSVIVSVLYALMPPFAVWVLARAIWGFCFSSLRFSKLQYISLCHRMGAAMGWTAGIGGVIQICSNTAGPWLVDHFSGGGVFLIYAVLCLLLLPLLLHIPSIDLGPQKVGLNQLRLPDSVDLWAFLINFTFAGMLIVALSTLLKNSGDQSSLLWQTSLLISLRRAIGIIFGPLFGLPIDHWGHKNSFFLSVALLLTGLGLLVFGQNLPGLLICFIGATCNQTLLPIIRLNTCLQKDQFNAVTRFNTSQDMGSAFGALFGLSILQQFSNFWVFMIILVTLGVLCVPLSRLLENKRRGTRIKHEGMKGD